MRIEKWGDSLAIRLPAEVIEAFGLNEGDEVELRIAGARALEIQRPVSAEQREAALARLRESRWKLPPDWKFDATPPTRVRLVNACSLCTLDACCGVN